MELHASSVHRKLDSKVKIAGLEVTDLIFLLLLAAVMNLFFGRTVVAPYLVFMLPMIFGLVLFFGKRNKPDKYLVHLFRFYLMPQSFCAGVETKDELMKKRRIYE